MKVGVIDTGIDYNHPDLRRSYGGGRDLVDNDSDPMETKAAEGQGTLHGTHVAGIIAANGRIQGSHRKQPSSPTGLSARAEAEQQNR